MKNIVLIGMMGTSKSSAGSKLSKALKRSFIDCDAEYEKVYGEKIADTFNKYGEEFFRVRESNLIMAISKVDSSVIATGGGAVKDSRNMENLKNNGIIVNLTADAKTIFERTKNDKHRPLLKSNSIKNIQKLIDERKDLYSKYADITVDTTNLTVSETVNQIIYFLEPLL